MDTLELTVVNQMQAIDVKVDALDTRLTEQADALDIKMKKHVASMAHQVDALGTELATMQVRMTGMETGEPAAPLSTSLPHYFAVVGWDLKGALQETPTAPEKTSIKRRHRRDEPPSSGDDSDTSDDEAHSSSRASKRSRRGTDPAETFRPYKSRNVRANYPSFAGDADMYEIGRAHV
jgi:uncharacterized coiled-coil protein SlyX